MRVLPRGVVTVLVALQALAALAVAVLGVVTAVVGRTSSVRGGTFADLVTVVGAVLAAGGLVLAVVLVLALRSWRAGRPGAGVLVVAAEGLVVVAGLLAAFTQHRFWPLPVSGFLVAVAVLVSRRPDDDAD